MTQNPEATKKAAERSIRIAVSFLNQESPDLLVSTRVAVSFLAKALGRLAELEGVDHVHHLAYVQQGFGVSYHAGVADAINPPQEED